MTLDTRQYAGAWCAGAQDLKTVIFAVICQVTLLVVDR
jgi:hypothetical protein